MCWLEVPVNEFMSVVGMFLLVTPHWGGCSRMSCPVDGFDICEQQVEPALSNGSQAVASKLHLLMTNDLFVNLYVRLFCPPSLSISLSSCSRKSACWMFQMFLFFSSLLGEGEGGARGARKGASRRGRRLRGQYLHTLIV